MPPNCSKIQALRSSGALNRHRQKVRHPLFAENGFFDPLDLVQLKYETIRAVEVDGRPIAQASVDFGLSRPTIYEAQENFGKKDSEVFYPKNVVQKRPAN